MFEGAERDPCYGGLHKEESFFYVFSFFDQRECQQKLACVPLLKLGLVVTGSELVGEGQLWVLYGRSSWSSDLQQ